MHLVLFANWFFHIFILAFQTLRPRIVKFGNMPLPTKSGDVISFIRYFSKSNSIEATNNMFVWSYKLNIFVRSFLRTPKIETLTSSPNFALRTLSVCATRDTFWLRLCVCQLTVESSLLGKYRLFMINLNNELLSNWNNLCRIFNWVLKRMKNIVI